MPQKVIGVNVDGDVNSADNPSHAVLGVGGLTVDAWGVQKMSVPFSLFHGMWTFDIPASMWFMYENGTQVYTSTNIISSGGMAHLTADATKTKVIMESRECPRYQPNRGHLWSAALLCPSKTADGVRNFGLCTTENGAFFRLKADGLLYAVRLSGGVEVQEELIDTSVLTDFDVEKNNIYDIQFQWRAAGNYKFFIGDPAKGTSTLVHTFDLLGTLLAASTENPALPCYFSCERTTEDVTMKIGCADITSENGFTETHQYRSAYAENVSVNGISKPVMVVRQPLQINSNTNTRTLQLARISFTSTKKGTFKVWSTRDGAAITTPTYQTINAGSFVETDSPDTTAGAVRATAVTVSSLEFVTAVPVEAAVSREVDNPLRERITFPIVRGDYIVITGTFSTASCDVTMEWGEQV